MKKLLYVLILLIPIYSISQDDNIFERLCAVKNIKNQVTYYNDGNYYITLEGMLFSYSESTLNMAYSLYKVVDDKKEVDTLLRYENLVVRKEEKRTDSITEYISYFFIKNQTNSLVVVQFNVFNKVDLVYERAFIEMVVENKIPSKCYQNQKIDSINFLGRKFFVDASCEFMNVNSIHCPKKGQISWSVHKSINEAEDALRLKFMISKSKDVGEIIYDDYIDVEFEGNDITARKVIYNIADNPKLLMTFEDAEALTIYYVATQVRGKYVSCVLSSYDTDELNDNGLSNYLSKVMTIK